MITDKKYIIFDYNNQDKIIRVIKKLIRLKLGKRLHKLLYRVHPAHISNIWDLFVRDEK